MSKEIIYLDHAAATPVDEHVLSAMKPYFSDIFFNPSSPYLPAKKARSAYDDAKRTIASVLGVKPGELTMTAGATESINLAFNSVTGHVVVPASEHEAVLASAKRHKHTLVKPDKQGVISAYTIAAAITPKTELVSVSLANNELGTIQPLRDISAVIKEERKSRLSKGDKTPIYLHSDASQGAGQVDLAVSRLGVDMLTLNAAKMYGPKQVGLLWAASGVHLQPQIVGGGQEQNTRSGTENVAGVVGFAKALETVSEHRKNEATRLAKLRDDLQARLVEALPEAMLSGHLKHRLSGHLNISFPGLDGERLVFLLENRGVLVATGSACAANKGKRSHVLTSIGLSPEVIDGSIRITLGQLSTPRNIRRASRIMIEEVKKEYSRVGQ